MALDLLFPNFDELIRTPEDVQRLNEAILQLAVQGNLVPQDPEDEPASELLERIESERDRWIKGGRTSKRELLPEIVQDEIPFAIPKGWVWCRLGTIGDWGSGATPRRGVAGYYDDGTIPWLKTGELNDGFIDSSEEYITELALQETSLRVNQPGDVLIAMYGATIGKLGILQIEATTNQACCACRPFSGVYNRFLFYYLRSLREHLRAKGAGGAQPNISKDKIVNTLFPLPSFAEQHRIVAKVDELFAQTRALEARLRRAQADVVTVNRAALHRLHTAQDEDQFQVAWRTLCDHFDVLYDDPRNVAELRQAILDLAVRGKLVAQDPNDEPAEEWLKRINGNRSRDLGKKPSSTPQYEAIISEVPYALPVSWSWAPFIDVADIATNSTDPGLFPDLPHIAPDNIEKFTGRLLAYRTVAEDGVSSVNHHFFPGQILYSKIRPNLSKAVMIDFEGLCSADMYPIQPLTNTRYLHLYILSSVFLSMVTRTDTRVAMPKINQEALSKVPVAVPPLAEQQLIVAKVDQLMRLCDALEAGLAQSQSQRHKLVAAMLA